jgi:uncharacterized membrane protein (DUF4010 family)
VEREWSGHATGPNARFAGARTFLLLGMLGGIAGLLMGFGWIVGASVLLAGGAALAVTAYAALAWRGGPDQVDGTTEAAALLVLALGAASGLGLIRLAAATGAVLVLALREKNAVQRFVQQLDEIELRAAFQFAVLALVLLPLLPAGPYGPLGGFRPRELWIVVLIVSGLNFAGYIARRATGAVAGTVLAGMLGGLFSSTAVSLTLSRQSREHPEGSGPLALGVVAACGMLLPRLAVLTLALQPELLPALLPFLLPQVIVCLLALVIGVARRDRPRTDLPLDKARNPLRLGSALLLAVGFQTVLMVVSLVRSHFGGAGILVTAGFLGLTDMDALTLSMSRLASSPDLHALAAAAMAVGLLANTLLKLSVVLALGAGAFRRIAGVWLLALAGASALGLWLGAR